MLKTSLIQASLTSRRLTAVVAAAGFIAALPLAVGAAEATAPLPTDQRVLLTPSEQALQDERQRSAGAARRVIMQAAGSGSTVGPLPTDQRVLLTPNEQAMQDEQQRRAEAARPVIADRTSVEPWASAPLPTDQRI